jgi:N utilization substance protein B
MSKSAGIGARRRARETLFRLIYPAELPRDSIAEAWKAVREDERLPDDARGYADDLVKALEESLHDIDARVEMAAEHWKLDRIAATDKSVLRLGTAELLYMAGTPARVVIDECVDIARKYGREESGKFVNGVLDRVARDTRPGEFDTTVPGSAPGPAAGRRPR